MVKPSDIVVNGCASGCPFCNAVVWKKPALQTRVVLISGFQCGDRGEIIELDADPDTFICRMDREPETWSYRLNRRQELIIPEDKFSIPNWAPPLALEDASYIHKAMVCGFAQAVSDCDSSPLDRSTQELITAIWARRLPLNFEDVWPMLAAHGWNAQFPDHWATVYDFGMSLLRHATGRKAVKRKRMTPFAANRYIPGSRS